MRIATKPVSFLLLDECDVLDRGSVTYVSSEKLDLCDKTVTYCIGMSLKRINMKHTLSDESVSLYSVSLDSVFFFKRLIFRSSLNTFVPVSKCDHLLMLCSY
jgi:hypothetical protein